MDAFGHVNNTRFLTYLEEARVDLLFVHAGEEVARERLSSGIVVARHEIDYKAPLVFRPEPVPIDVWVSRLGNASFTVRYEIQDEDGPVYVRGRDRPGAVRRRRRASPPVVGRGACSPRTLSRAMSSHVVVADEVDRRASLTTSTGSWPWTTGRPCDCRPEGRVLGVWCGPPFEVVALRPVALGEPVRLDATVSAQRLLERSRKGLAVEIPAAVSGPTWVGLLPPRSGWEERLRSDVGNVRAAVEMAKHFFHERADGVTDRAALEKIAHDVWERTCSGRGAGARGARRRVPGADGPRRRGRGGVRDRHVDALGGAWWQRGYPSRTAPLDPGPATSLTPCGRTSAGPHSPHARVRSGDGWPETSRAPSCGDDRQS